MTQVGHLLTGAAFGSLCLPPRASKRGKALHLAVFMLLATIPDLPFKYWSHDRYDISHSLFSNLILIGLLGAGLEWKAGKTAWARQPAVKLLGVLAWLSHLLLDTFYNHGIGVMVLWPLSTERLALPIPWFSVVKLPLWPLRADILQVFAIELVSYLPLVGLAGWLRKRREAARAPVLVHRAG